MVQRFDSDKWLKKFELSEFPQPESYLLRYPVLLCHGYGAIASLIKPSPLHDVAMLYRSHNVRAYAPNIVPYAKIETRAGSWVSLIEKIIARSPDKKLNIIAHSMGGLDIRYAVAKLDIAPHIASITTVSTPHRGSSLADLSLKTPHIVRDKLGEFLDWMGDRIYPQTKSNSVGSAEQLSRKYAKEVFNEMIQNDPEIPYYSYSSAVGKGTAYPINMLNRFQNNYIYDREGLNDGMVSVESAKWGEHQGTAALSHLEQMNVRVKEERKEMFESFWLDIVKMLKDRGH